MRDYIDIGPAPCDEDCAQIGQLGFHERNMSECKRFIELIRATLGLEPEGARLGIKAHQHEFGTYREVVCYYDDENDKATEYAFRCESEVPSRWDDDPEVTLRALWTRKGVPKEMQDEIIRDAEAKAQPGAMVGPFRIGG
jgi:hypothetical protein